MARQAGLTMPDLTDPGRMRAARPADWFELISNGTVQQGGAMPPFGQGSSRPLSEQDRWNVLFYVWTLSTTSQRIDQGKLIYSQRCSTCHGDDGRGQGPGAAGKSVPDFTDQARMAGRSQNDLFTAISQGQGPDQAMPGFADVLSEDERWAVADYVRTFSYGYAAPEQKPERYTVAGRVTNGTPGGKVPASLPVTLHVYNAVTETATFTTTVAADGSYRFADVMIPPDAISEVEARQGDAPFYTMPFTYPLTTRVITVPVQIFDLTADPSVIRLDQWHIVFPSVSESALDVLEIYIYSNTSDYAYAPPAQGAQGLGTVRFPLPREATNISLMQGGTETTFVRTDEGLVYTLPVQPGQHTVALAYSLPFNGRTTVEQKPLYPVGSVVVLAPKGEMTVSSPQLSSQSEQQLDNQTYLVYGGGPLAAGSSLTLTVAASQSFPVELVVGAGSLGAVLIGVGVWWWRRRVAVPVVSLAADTEARRQELLQAIADLDDAYEAGKVDNATYEKRRANMKRELVALMRGRG